MSALVDGELSAAALSGLFAEIETDSQSLGHWHAYHLIGDVLRSSNTVVSSRAPGDFLAEFRERLTAESAVVAVQPAVTRVEAVPPVAANDAVFRWKMVAGVASVAAVMAVSWSLIGVAPQGAGGASGPQLAVVSPAPAGPSSVVPIVSVAPAPPSREVAVNTGQGVVIRDARLEELLAEHRQHGGMSALQMPTGFIRGATYDATDR